MSRPSKYETHIKPYFDKIKEALEKGIYETEIAKTLGVSNSSWFEYKTKYSEFADIFKNADRSQLLNDLENALIKKAKGFEYQEKKQYIKKDDNGEVVTYTEISTRYQPPSETAIFGALNRFDPNYKKDKAYYELKKQELKLKKEVAKAKNFDLDID